MRRRATRDRRVEVAGVSVSTTTSSAASGSRPHERFEDSSPIDERAARRGVARRAPDEVDRAVRRRARRLPRLGGARRRRAAPLPAPAGRPDRRERRPPRRRRVRGHGDAAALAAGARDRPRGAQLPRLRRPRRRLRGARLALERHLEPRAAHAGGPGRGDHAVERALHALDLEDGARRWPPAARSSSSRPSGRRSRARCSPTSSPRRGFPPGVFNIVQGIGEEAGAALVAHPLVRRVSFTGSPETARHIGVAAAAQHRSVHRRARRQEPASSCSPTPTSTRPRARRPASTTTRARCASPARASSSRSQIRDVFLEQFHLHADEHVLGDPRDDATTVSPLIHPEHLARVEGFVERAREAGDRIVRGGKRAELGGLWYEPTLVEPRSNDSEIVQREVFGPVLTFQTLPRRGRGRRARELDRVRALGDRLHGLDRPGRARRPRDPRGHGLGQLLPGARPDRAVRRLRHLAASAARAATTRSTSTPT